VVEREEATDLNSTSFNLKPSFREVSSQTTSFNKEVSSLDYNCNRVKPAITSQTLITSQALANNHISLQSSRSSLQTSIQSLQSSHHDLLSSQESNVSSEPSIVYSQPLRKKPSLLSSQPSIVSSMPLSKKPSLLSSQPSIVSSQPLRKTPSLLSSQPSLVSSQPLRKKPSLLSSRPSTVSSQPLSKTPSLLSSQPWGNKLNLEARISNAHHILDRKPPTETPTTLQDGRQENPPHLPHQDVSRVTPESDSLQNYIKDLRTFVRTPKPSRKLSLKIRGDKVEYENVVVAQPKRKLERKYSRASALSRTSDKRSSDEFSLTGDGTTDRKVVIDQIDEVTKSIFREGRSPTNTIRMLDIDFL